MAPGYHHVVDPVDIQKRIKAARRKLQRYEDREAALSEPVYGRVPDIRKTPCDAKHSYLWPVGPARFKLLYEQQRCLRQLASLHKRLRQLEG